jgi:hypothetical protein
MEFTVSEPVSHIVEKEPKPKRSKKSTIDASLNSNNSVNSLNSTNSLNLPSDNTNAIQFELTYENFCKHNLVLKSYKIPELKICARKYHLPVSGAKPFLMERIEKQFRSIKARTKIQKMYRGYIVRKMMSLHGPALKNRSLCSNETDFATMEPLSEIENNSFFSYADQKKFVYGFNVTSLISMMKTKSKVINPYNREKLEQSTINEIISLYNIACIIFPDFRAENEPYHTTPRNTLRNYSHNTRYPQNQHSHNNQNHQNQQHNQSIRASIVHYNPTIHAVSLMSDQNHYARYREIQELRTKPIEQRITGLFIEFDQLGNYTTQSWFTSLQYRDYIRLYRNLFEIWNYRGMLSREIKLRICPYHGPFDGIFTRPVHYNELSLDEIKLACLIALENLVYSGTDDDSRKIGAFHALSGLTLVSTPARMSMPWLYDSVADGQIFV